VFDVGDPYLQAAISKLRNLQIECVVERKDELTVKLSPTSHRHFREMKDFMDFVWKKRDEQKDKERALQPGARETSRQSETGPGVTSARGTSGPERELEDARAEIVRLRVKGKQAVKERDEWKSRALTAEATLAASGTSGEADTKFREIKRRFALLYHPDHHGGTAIERAVKTEIFKEFWEVIEGVEKRREKARDKA
jgi:hypothetical protein